jgi:dienelactone hydrolase
MHAFLILSLSLAITMIASAKLHTEALAYKDGDTALEGYLAYDDSFSGQRPAVLVCHEWWGLVDYAKRRAEQLASLGYVAFALDMYGKRDTAKTPEEAMAKVKPFYSDRSLMRRRALAGLSVLRENPLTDPKRIAVIGYCFGGTTALEIARSGADVAGVVSFHGVLTTANPADARNIKCKVLVLTGADDPNVPADQVKAFEEEMRGGGVDWQLVSYGGAVHAFTNPAAGNDPSKGAAYNERADRRSWEAMKSFFAEIFK